MFTDFSSYFVDDNEDDDVFVGEVTTPCRHSTDTKTDSSTDSAVELDRSKYNQRHGWNVDDACSAHSTEDVADDSEDYRISSSASVDGDLERRKSGFQRRRLGQLQLKHRLAVDLPEYTSPVTRGTHLEEPGFTAKDQKASAVGRPSSFAPESQNRTVLDFMWNSLDDSDYQFYAVFIVTLATLATALHLPPAWLILVVACMSLLHFSIAERRSGKHR